RGGRPAGAAGATRRLGRLRPLAAVRPSIVGPRAAVNLTQCLRALGRTAEARRLALGLVADPDVGEAASAILAELDAAGQGGAGPGTGAGRLEPTAPGRPRS